MSSSPRPAIPPLSQVTSRNLLFVSGKGGVGKTAVSQAIAAALVAKGRRALWATFEDPTRPKGEIHPVSKNLWHLNCDATRAFEEYISLKIGMSALAQFFVNNKLIRYLSQAAPGIHELVLLGKIWHERLNYDHVVVDMPSTGYGVAMFQSTVNFARLFRGGPIHRDSEDMLATFQDPRSTGHLIVALPEEMPLRESLELNDYLFGLFPANPAAFLVNRRFPALTGDSPGAPDSWPTPVPRNAEDYAVKRSVLEDSNLRLWRGENVPFSELPYVLPPADARPEAVVGALTELVVERGFL